MLGPLVCERDGEPVPLPSGRQRSLLALLLMGAGPGGGHRGPPAAGGGWGPVSRDRLIDELWGARPPASAVSALHVHLSKLRGALGGLLVLEPAGYALAPGAFGLDVWRFDELVERGRSDPGQARVLLREALGLFRGEPLCDVASEGAVAQWRRALEDRRLEATLLRVDADLAAGAAGELVAELEGLVAEHQFEERLWGQLMLALHRADRQVDALDAYQRVRRLFAAELGLDPGEPLARLHQGILDRDPGLLLASEPPAERPGPAAGAAGSATGSAGAAGMAGTAGGESALAGGPRSAGGLPARPATTLPRSLTRLIGRERDLGVLQGLMADPDVRMLTLTGPGGVGKTRLLLELARAQEPDFADGAVFVRLERLTDPALVAAEIAGALARRDTTEAPSADGLASYLTERELLMVIDNFEHLLSAGVLVAELLALAPKLRVLISSRTALRLRGEHVVEVEPLELPAGDSVEEAALSPAVRLFLQCALASNRKLTIDADATRTVAIICRALDGLPLAIELAASRSHSLNPAQIADQLAQPLSIGEHALRDLPDRQQTLQATIRWSYDLLTPSAQEGLRAAAAFLGGFTAPALEAAAGRPAGLDLDELLGASLVRRQSEPGRYELLELVRAFALAELRSGEQAAQTRARHRRYFAARVAAVSEAFTGGTAPGELAPQLLADHANLRAALEDAIEAGDQSSALGLALGLRPLWMTGMLRQESQELVDRLLERFDIPAASEVPLLQAVAFLDFGPTADNWNRRLADRAREIGDVEAMATATGNLFGHALNARNREEMSRLRPVLLSLVTPETSPKALGWIQYFLALDAYTDGRMAEAVEHATLSTEHAAAIGHEYMLASAVATRLLAQSARDGTIDHGALTEAVAGMRRINVQPLAAFALWLVARYAAATDPVIARRCLAQAERIVAMLDSELWPESVLRDETMAILGIDDVTALLAGIPPLDHAAALSEAAAWLAQGSSGESAARPAPGRPEPAVPSLG